MGRAWRRTVGRLERGPASRFLLRSLAGAFALALLLVLVSFLVDEPLRRSMEKQINRRLTGYSVRVPRLHFRLLGLSVTLRDVVVRQDSNPEPPVAVIPRLHASVQWKALLSLRLVADFLFERPRVYVNLTQLRTETNSKVALKDRGWQEAALAIYPLQINLLQIRDADVTYVDEDPHRPLHFSQLDLRANDIRNIRSKGHVYPSPIHAEAVVFESGRAVADGHADFLAEPHPGLHVRFSFQGVPLDSLRPIVSRSNVLLRGGVLSTAGRLEYAPAAKSVHLADLTIRGLRVDYVRHPGTPAAVTEKRAATQAASSPRPARRSLAVRLDQMSLIDSDLGIVNQAASPPYRAFIDEAELRLSNFANRPGGSPGAAALQGQFMGSGRTKASLVLNPDRGKNGPTFDLKVAIDETDMKRMNSLLRAYGSFDVAAGVFSLFSELHVRDGTIRGYVKPLFRDMRVYDRRQDKEKGLLRKVYEGLVGVVAKLLENRRDEVGTVVELEGRIGDPDSNTLQILGGLLENAFFKAILPGFEREISR